MGRVPDLPVGGLLKVVVFYSLRFGSRRPSAKRSIPSTPASTKLEAP